MTYDWAALTRDWRPEQLKPAFDSLWRYAPVLPADRPDAVTLGEGSTPQLRTPSLGDALGLADLWIKDESRSPTGSWEVRGVSVAVTAAKVSGARKLSIGSTAAGAAALGAYAAAAGLPARVYVPFDSPPITLAECAAYGAEVILSGERVDECVRAASAGAGREDWFDLSSVGEPFRLEGEKTIGYEIAEQFRWRLPDVILCPYEAGASLIGMWKAFAELEKLTWIGSKRPRLVAVQTSATEPEPRHKSPLEKAIRESGGALLSISPEEAIGGTLLLSGKEGILAALGAGACVGALSRLLQSRCLQSQEKTVFINTASGLKNPEMYLRRFPHRRGGEQDKLGGLITPR